MYVCAYNSTSKVPTDKPATHNGSRSMTGVTMRPLERPKKLTYCEYFQHTPTICIKRPTK